MADVVRDMLEAEARRPLWMKQVINEASSRLEQASRAPSWEAAAITEVRNEHDHVPPGYNPPLFRDDFHLKLRFYESVKRQLEVGEDASGSIDVRLPRPF